MAAGVTCTHVFLAVIVAGCNVGTSAKATNSSFQKSSEETCIAPTPENQTQDQAKKAMTTSCLGVCQTHATLVLLHAVLCLLQDVMLGSQARRLSAAVPQEVEFDLAKLRTRLKRPRESAAWMSIECLQHCNCLCCAVFIAECDAELSNKATINSSASGGGV